MNDDKRDSAWFKNPWIYLLVAPAFVGISGSIGGVLFEYIVAKPVEDEPSIAILVRLGSLLTSAAFWVTGLVLLLWLLKSIIQRDGRARWVRGWEWVTGLRLRAPITTARRRRALARTEAEQRRDLKRRNFEEGYQERDAEVVAERASVRKPDWSIEGKEHLGRVDYYLYNYAYPVSKVWLTAPIDDFDFEGSLPRFADPFTGAISGGFSGKFFPGHPTDKGLREGVEFEVHWVDELGDPQEEVLRVGP